MANNIFKRWSLKYTRQIILSIIFLVAVLCMTLFMLTAGLRCVDEFGCLREHCDFKSFRKEYQLMIRSSMANNNNCRI